MQARAMSLYGVLLGNRPVLPTMMMTSESPHIVNAASASTPTEPRTAFDRISLRRLVLIRSVAVTGQALTLLIVHFLLDFRLPLLPALIVVGASVLLNLGSMLFHRAGTRLGERAAALYLAWDTLQLAILLYLTGGLENPF